MPPITAVLNATSTGTGSHTVVLANGLGTTQYTWRHVIDALAPHCRVVGFDHVGTPDADLTHYDADRYATLHAYADDAVALLDEMGVADATWVGHSVGGMIGLLAAAAAPDRIGRLALLSASPRYLDAVGYHGGFTREAVDALLGAVASDYHSWVGGFSPLAIGRDDRPEAVGEFATSLRRMRPDVAHRTLRTIFLGDYRATLPRVRQPVTVIQPRDDVAVPPEVGRYLAAQLPSAAYRELDATGHVPHLTDPDAVIAVLDEVFRDVLGHPLHHVRVPGPRGVLTAAAA